MPQIGDMPYVEALFTDAGGPADPTTVTLRIRKPDGTETTNSSPTRVSVGLFREYVLLDQSGRWLWQFKGTGAVPATIEGHIDVDRSLFEPEPPGSGPRDYFTRAEFRAWAGDTGEVPHYDDSDIDDAQAEVIDRLEAWGKTSWANVTGVAGDGTAAVYRVAAELVSGAGTLVLSRIPVHEFTSLTIEGATDVLDAAGYRADLDAGIVRIGVDVWGWPVAVLDPLFGLEIRRPRFAAVYSYGWGACPRSVKTSAMAATRSRIDGWNRRPGGAQGTRIPSNTRRLSSSRADLEFDEKAATDPTPPWPWDAAASGEIVSYWEGRRPRTRVSVMGG